MRRKNIITFPLSSVICSDMAEIEEHKGGDAQPLAQTEKKEKEQKHIFICQQVTPAHHAWQARFQSHYYRKCQECFHLYSFIPSCCSCFSRWVVVIDRAVCFHRAGLEAVAFSLLSLYILKECSQETQPTKMQRIKKLQLKRHISDDVFIKCLNL